MWRGNTTNRRQSAAAGYFFLINNLETERRSLVSATFVPVYFFLCIRRQKGDGVWGVWVCVGVWGVLAFASVSKVNRLLFGFSRQLRTTSSTLFFFYFFFFFLLLLLLLLLPLLLLLVVFGLNSTRLAFSTGGFSDNRWCNAPGSECPVVNIIHTLPDETTIKMADQDWNWIKQAQFDNRSWSNFMYKFSARYWRVHFIVIHRLKMKVTAANDVCHSTPFHLWNNLRKTDVIQLESIILLRALSWRKYVAHQSVDTITMN